MPKEMTIKITSDEVMELKMLRDELARNKPLGVAIGKNGVQGSRGTDETRTCERRIETINAILKRAATA